MYKLILTIPESKRFRRYLESFCLHAPNVEQFWYVEYFDNFKFAIVSTTDIAHWTEFIHDCKVKHPRWASFLAQFNPTFAYKPFAIGKCNLPPCH